MKVPQINVTTIYFNRSLEKEIYMEPPEILEQTLEKRTRTCDIQNCSVEKPQKTLNLISRGSRLKKALYDFVRRILSD